MSTKALIGLLAAIVALCAWMWLRSAPVAPPPLAVAGPESASGLVQRPVDAPVPVEQASASSPDRSTVAVRADAAAAPADPRAGWWLVGRLLDWDPNEPVAAELDINRSGRAPVKAAAKLDGSFEIDISKLFEARSEGRAAQSEPGGAAEPAIEIWARHADYLPARELIPGDVIVSARAPDERVELRRDVQLRHAASVTGRVRVEGAPNAHGAEVTLLPPEGQHFSGFGGVASANCDGEGRYRLRAPRSGEYVLLATLTGWRPAAVRVLLTERASLEIPDLVLEAGTAEIRGRVDLPPGVDLNEDDSPWSLDFSMGVEVHAHPWNRSEAEVPMRGTADSVLVREDNKHLFPELRGGWPDKTQIARVKTGGEFVLAGLDPGEWELQIHGIRSSALLAMKQPAIIVAPARDVVLGRHLCRVTALVTEGGRAVKAADVAWGATLENGSQQFQTTSTDQGRVVVIGDVSMNYSASVFRAGRKEASIELPAAGRPRDHVVEIALAEDEPPARLVLRVPEGARPLEHILVHLMPAAPVGSEPGRHGQRIDRRCDLHERAYTLSDLPAGRYSIEVGPSDDRGPVAFYGSFLMTERFDIDFSPGAQEERVLALKSGGRLRIEVEGFTEGEHMAPFEVVDAQGAKAPGPNVVAEEGDGRGTFYATHGKLSLKHPNAIQPCLVPGIYEVRVNSAEYDVGPVRVEVRELETVTAKLKALRR